MAVEDEYKFTRLVIDKVDLVLKDGSNTFQRIGIKRIK